MILINLGLEMHNLAKELWPLNRSITGKGLRETLSVIRKHIPKIKIINVASGKKILDWTVPKEWVVIDAYIKTPSGKKICEFRKNNLFLLGYSSPVNKIMPLDELQKYLQAKVLRYTLSCLASRPIGPIRYEFRALVKNQAQEIMLLRHIAMQ